MVAEVDPAAGARRLGEEDGRLAGRGIDLEHVELALRAVLALDVERAAVGGPVDAGEVDVLVRAEIDLDLVAAVRD